MKKIFILATISAISTSVFAAENKFDGTYLGLNAGHANVESKGTEHYAYSDTNTNYGDPSGYTFNNPSINSGLIGGFIGFNRTLNNNVLLGIEADYEFRNGKRTTIEDFEGAPDTDYSVKSQLKNAASIRAKIGYVFNDKKTLAYITAGFAAAKITTTFNDLSEAETVSESHSAWHNGWTAGLGLEHFLNDKISIKGEYRHSDYGNKTNDISMYETYYDIKLKENAIRIGIAYHF